jgi:HAD superfamily hydrolase (TIGR01509 family)
VAELSTTIVFTMKSPVSLVIFDCDGVLVDSETLSNRVVVEAVRELGLVLNLQEAITLFKGCKMADCVAILSDRLGRPLPADFESSLRARTAEAFRRDLQAVPGVHAALGRITTPVCVASSGPREKITLALSVTGLLPRFEGRIFSSYEIGSWKPAPDLFLHAAASLGATPGSCAVVEDSAVGIRAGLAAGMTLFAYVADSDAMELESLGATPFQHMNELPALLQRQGNATVV